MYVRIKSNPSKTTWKVMICQSKRHGTKVVQQILKYLGVAKSPDQLAALKRIGLAEIHSLEIGRQESEHPQDTCEGAPLGHMTEIARISDGFHEVFGKTFEVLNFGSIFDKNLCEKLKDLIIGRIVSPSSKRCTSKLLAKNYGKQLSEDAIYRLLDRLYASEEEIQTRIFETTKQFSVDSVVDVLLFDVTTLYFESQKSDELRDFGYSKDRKINEVQVVLALATTPEGLPIGYTLFSGKTAEVNTLLKCMQDWKTTFPIQNVCVVADRAMMSERNLASMEGSFFNYVIAAKLRSLPKRLRETILSRQTEMEISASGEPVRIQEHTIGNRRLVVSYSESRAHKDRSDRERLLARLSQKAPKAETSPKRLVTNRGYLKYFKEQSPGKMIFDEARIFEEARWDGLHGIITNDLTASAASLFERYRRLWVIEESFRINKHTLEMRPIFHFKPRRIRAHILLCYLAFAVARYTQRQVATFYAPLSIERIRDTLNEVESSILEDEITGERYKMPSAISLEAKNIYMALGLKRSSRPCKLFRQQKKCSALSKNLSL